MIFIKVLESNLIEPCVLFHASGGLFIGCSQKQQNNSFLIILLISHYLFWGNIQDNPIWYPYWEPRGWIRAQGSLIHSRKNSYWIILFENIITKMEDKPFLYNNTNGSKKGQIFYSWYDRIYDRFYRAQYRNVCGGLRSIL